jgi:hypothetical protein
MLVSANGRVLYKGTLEFHETTIWGGLLRLLDK